MIHFQLGLFFQTTIFSLSLVTHVVIAIFVAQLRIDRFTTSTEIRFTFHKKAFTKENITFTIDSATFRQSATVFHEISSKQNHLQTLNQTLLKTYTNSNLFYTNVCRVSSIQILFGGDLFDKKIPARGCNFLKKRTGQPQPSVGQLNDFSGKGRL